LDIFEDGVGVSVDDTNVSQARDTFHRGVDLGPAQVGLGRVTGVNADERTAALRRLRIDPPRKAVVRNTDLVAALADAYGVGGSG
jgi:hypothetical protein